MDATTTPTANFPIMRLDFDVEEQNTMNDTINPVSGIKKHT